MGKKYVILYNELSNGGKGLQAAEALQRRLQGDAFRVIACNAIDDYHAFFASLDKSEQLIILGGDGTLNRFINETEGIRDNRSIYFSPNGSGNDFWHDIEQPIDGMPICLDRYMKHLPKVIVNGRTIRYFNSVGFGIDGYVCVEGERVRALKPNQKVNYTGVALKGLLYAFKPVEAEVTVDGVTRKYSKVWLAPTMIGRFFGGGMQITPMQRRLNKDHTVTVAVAHDLSNLRILSIFPHIFDGTHAQPKYAKYIDFIHGHSVHVRFSRPTALSVDGEIFPDVTEYAVEYT